MEYVGASPKSYTRLVKAKREMAIEGAVGKLHRMWYERGKCQKNDSWIASAQVTE